jgi:thiamine pyrophosphate-dependent acetolactate synthase large subunit-like protein
MKDLIKQYLDHGVSRRNFLAGLAGVGLTAAAADAMADSLAPFQLQTPSSDGPPAWMRQMRGTGGALFVAQLKAAGIRHLFCNPHGASGPFYDALVDEPDLHVIKAMEEGALGAMCDGYAKASGKPAFATCDAAGMPAFVGQMFVSWSDRIPVVLAIDDDSIPNATNSITKWQWIAERADTIPAVTRQALKFATTYPYGPVFLVVSGAALSGQGQSAVMDQEKFSVPLKIRPDPAAIDRAARLLVEARNPILYYGDDVTWCGAEKELLELAELLGMPTVDPGRGNQWSKPFPTRHPLFQGQVRQTMGFPGEPDVVLNAGAWFRAGLRVSPRTSVIEIRLDPETLARNAPVDVPILADLKLALTDLVSAVRSRATAARLKELSEPRIARARENRAKMDAHLKAIAARHAERTPLSLTHVIVELENVLEKDTCIVENGGNGTESLCHEYMNIGGDNKRYIKQSPQVLGWGVGAAFGAALARPDNPVVALVGDGEFMFRGPQPLWSYARYHAPVTVIVENNMSYDNERNRLWQRGGRQFDTGRDMICYNGDPDIDFAKLASGLGVEGEVVKEPSALRPSLERAKRANADGRPYLLDMHIERGGVGSQSAWHPGYSIAAQRTRRG